MVLSELTAPQAATAYRTDGASGSAVGPVRTRSYLGSQEPWSRRALSTCSGLALLGVVVVVVCWWGGSDRRTAEDQASWLIGSIVGTAAFALAGAGWILSGFRAVRRGMRDLAADKRVFALGGAIDAGERDQDVPVDGSTLVVGPGMIRAHRADCLLVQGKQVRPVASSDARLEQCGVCLP
jgi:hypothetical protein